MQGASPLASPGLNPRGTGKGGEPRTRRGACLVCRPPTPPLVYFFAPIPLPPSPTGKGEIQGFFMQGASPLASPGLNPRGTGKGGEPRTRRGLPRRCRLTLPLWYSQGSAPSLSPACPAFCFPFCPLSPHPLPRRGRGIKVISCKGLRPLHPLDRTRAALGKGANHAPSGGLAPGVAA